MRWVFRLFWFVSVVWNNDGLESAHEWLVRSFLARMSMCRGYGCGWWCAHRLRNGKQACPFFCRRVCRLNFNKALRVYTELVPLRQIRRNYNVFESSSELQFFKFDKWVVIFTTIFYRKIETNQDLLCIFLLLCSLQSIFQKQLDCSFCANSLVGRCAWQYFCASSIRQWQFKRNLNRKETILRVKILLRIFLTFLSSTLFHFLYIYSEKTLKYLVFFSRYGPFLLLAKSCKRSHKLHKNQFVC